MLWLVTAGAVLSLLSAAPDSGFVTQALNRPGTVIIGRWQPAHPEIADWHAQRAISVTGVTELEHALSAGLPSGVRFVVLDIERWNLTPASDQQDPVRATCDAARLAHAHDLLLIAAPATDLIWVVNPAEARRDGQWRAFIASGLAGRMAPCADWYVIQAERAEENPKLYRDYSQDVAKQVRDSKPDAMVLGELETNHAGRAVAASLLQQDVANTRRFVRGYWLGIPQSGVYCTDCGAARPNVALSLLRWLASGGGP